MKKYVLLLVVSFVFCWMSPSVSAQVAADDPSTLTFANNACAILLRTESAKVNSPIGHDALFSKIVEDRIEVLENDGGMKSKNCDLKETFKTEVLEAPPANWIMADLLKGGIYGACWDGLNNPSYSDVVINYFFDFKESEPAKLQDFKDKCSEVIVYVPNLQDRRANIIDVVYFPSFVSKFQPFVEARYGVDLTSIPTSAPIVSTDDIDKEALQAALKKNDCGVESKQCCMAATSVPGQEIPPVAGEGTNPFNKLLKTVTEWGKKIFIQAQFLSETFFGTLEDENRNPCWDGSAYRFYDKDEHALDPSNDTDLEKLTPIFQTINQIEEHTATWANVRHQMELAEFTCQCERDAGRGTIGTTLGVQTQSGIVQTKSQKSTPSVLGVFDEYGEGMCDGNVNDTDCNNAVMRNYCNLLTPLEMTKKYGELECMEVLDDRLLPAEKRCSPLTEISNDEEEYAKCKKCVWLDDGTWTTLGCFYADFERTLNERVFGLVIGLVGTIALGCIIYAAFLMQTSGGNPEKTGKAQELMTSCIAGLIIIIFSVFILKVIGVDILRIPGFGTEAPVVGDTDTSTTEPTPASGSSTPRPIATPTRGPSAPSTTPTRAPTGSASSPSPTLIAAIPSTTPTATFSPVPPTPTPLPTAAVLSANDCAQSDNPGSRDIYLFDRANFEGPCLRLTIGGAPDFNNLKNEEVDFTNLWSFGQCDNGNYDDCIASIKVGSEVQIELYNSKNYDGTAIRVKESIDKLQSSILDKVSSAKVCVNPNKAIGEYKCPGFSS